MQATRVDPGEVRGIGEMFFTLSIPIIDRLYDK